MIVLLSRLITCTHLVQTLSTSTGGIITGMTSIFAPFSPTHPLGAFDLVTDADFDVGVSVDIPSKRASEPAGGRLGEVKVPSKPGAAAAVGLRRRRVPVAGRRGRRVHRGVRGVRCRVR